MNDANADQDVLACLSDRERLVAQKAAEGLTHRQIADELFIAPGTARTHLATVYRKLGVHNRAELVRLIHSPTATHSFANWCKIASMRVLAR